MVGLVVVVIPINVWRVCFYESQIKNFMNFINFKKCIQSMMHKRLKNLTENR